MMRFNGTVTLAQLDDDNKQRVIFRIIPLSTKEGFIFQNRPVDYPDFGSIRVIPDKREQSSFKERMHSIGSLCCVQILTEGKELTKIRQNRNYDPNQGEFNQYAIYSDVICAFEDDAIFEVYQDQEDFSHALTETVLLQKGKLLYGPVSRSEQTGVDSLKPFNDEKYLLHTVEMVDGNKKCFCWNPEAIVNWRQRKKALRKDADPQPVKQAAPLPRPDNLAEIPQDAPKAQPTQKESIPAALVQDDMTDDLPIGRKLELLDQQRTNDEHISDLNKPLSQQANRLKQTEQPFRQEQFTQTQEIKGTPISGMPRTYEFDRQADHCVQGVVEKQLQGKQNGQNGEQRTDAVFNPIAVLRSALLDVWQIPALHQEFMLLLRENKEILKSILQLPALDRQIQISDYAAKAELDEIEARRISLLIEFDKVNANYTQAREKLLAEVSAKKQEELTALDQRKNDLLAECQAMEAFLNELAERVKAGSEQLLCTKATAAISSNGSEIVLAPITGYFIEKHEIVETVRSSMSGQGFLCKQACVAELIILLALYDEVCLLAVNLWEGELYVKNLLRSLGLLNVSAWPSAFTPLHIASFLPDNELRTPTIEVIKNNRTPIKAYGHKVIRIIDYSRIQEFENLPVFHVPELNKLRMQEDKPDCGKPISLQTIQAFGVDAEPLYKGCEDWFAHLQEELRSLNITVTDEVIYAMRTFIRIATPQVIGGFMEAVDAATLFWIIPILINQKLPKKQWVSIIGGMPRCMRAMNAQPCTAQ